MAPRPDRLARAFARCMLAGARRATPLDAIVAELGAASEAVTGLLDKTLEGIEAAIDLEHAVALIAGRIERAPWDDFAAAFYRAGLRAAMIGADDSDLEGQEEEPVKPEAFSRKPCLLPLLLAKKDVSEFIESGKLRPKPFDEAIAAFEAKQIVTRDVFDSMAAEQRARAFTVAGQTSTRAIKVMRDELLRTMKEGNYGKGAAENDLRAFRKKLAERWQSAGLSAAASMPAPSHLETVFRNGVMGAYAQGRTAQMTQPHVLAARPYWQVMTVNDGPPRQRKTHQAVHGWVMRADDPGWQQTATPFGMNCRCRLVARSSAWVERSSPHIHSGPLPNLPDPGWTTTPPPVVSIPEPASPEAQPPPELGREQQQSPALGPPPARGPAEKDGYQPLTPRHASFSTGVHSTEGVTTGGKIMPDDVTDAIGGLHKETLAMLEHRPLQAIRVGAGEGSHAYYDEDLRHIVLDRYSSPVAKTGAKVGEARFMTDVAEKGAEKAALLEHEIAHHLQASLETIDPQAFKAIGRSYRKKKKAITEWKRSQSLVRKRPLPVVSEYATHDEWEYFAENYSAWRLDRKALKALDPDGYNLVARVIKSFEKSIKAAAK